MSMEEKHTDAYLNDIQEKFLTHKQHEPQEVGLSWGQFLDSSISGGQVGLYGTVSAAIALKTKANDSLDATTAENELVSYWNKREEQIQHDNLCQNIRLAALLLGLCFCSHRDSDKVKEISIQLQNRLSSEELWSDSSKPIPGSPKYDFSSSIVIIFAYTSITLYKGDTEDFGDLLKKLEAAATALQKRYVDDPKRERTYLPVLLIAILFVHGKNAHTTVRRRFSEYAKNPENIFNRVWHHLDFVNKEGEYKRDYFIIPHRLLAPLLLLQPEIQGNHYLFAQAALSDIKKTLDSSGSKLFQEADGRPSSLEQALVALALHASRNTTHKKWTLLVPKCSMFMMKPRGPEMVFSWVLILFVYFPVCIVLSAEVLLGTTYPELWPGQRNLLEFAKTVPAWIPTLIAFTFSSLFEPKKMIKSAFGKDDEK